MYIANLKILFVVFILFVIFPILYTFGSLFFLDGSLFENIKLIDKETFLLLTKSCIISFIIALLSTVLGTKLGFILYKTNIQFRGFFKIILLLPLFLSPYILAVAWKDFFYLLFGNTDFISSYLGVIFVLTTVFTPLSLLIIGSGFSNISAQFEESGFVIANFKTVIFKITLPMIKPALISSFVLVFVLSISEFSVPAFFGVKVFTTEIFMQFSAFYNHSLAILQSALLIAVCVLLLFAERKYLVDEPFFSIGNKGATSRIYDLKKWNWLGLAFIIFWFLLSIILPFVVLFIQSFQEGSAQFVKALELLLPTFSSSIGLAFVGAIIIVLVGFSSAYLIRFAKNRIGEYFDWLLLFVFAIPSTIFGISLIKFYNHPMLDLIYSSSVIILIGYVGKFSFISSKLIGNAIKQIPNSLFEVAQLEGIKSVRQIQKILIPLVLPSFFIAFIISFIFSLSELGTTIMLYPPGTEIMPIKVFTIMANAPQSLVSSMTLVVFTITLFIIVSLFFIVKIFLKKYNFNYDNIN